MYPKVLTLVFGARALDIRFGFHLPSIAVVFCAVSQWPREEELCVLATRRVAPP